MKKLVPAFALASLLGACGPPDAPDAPTWTADVQPLLSARCVRCHHTPAAGNPIGTPNPYAGSLPATDFTIFKTPDEIAGLCPAPAGSMKNDCAFGAAFWAPTMVSYIAMKGSYRMPPPPAAELTERQLDIIKRWAADPLE